MSYLPRETSIYYSILDSSRNEQEKILLEPISYLLQKDKLKYQLKFSKAINFWLNISPEKANKIVNIVENLEAHIKLVDDIKESPGRFTENEINQRKSLKNKSVDEIFGIDRAIIADNIILLKLIEESRELNHNKAESVFVKLALEIHRGQCFQIFHQEKVIEISEEDYFNTIKLKIGNLFLLNASLMQLFSNSNEGEKDLKKLAEIFGVSQQIKEDLRNLKENNFNNIKYSLPVVRALQLKTYNSILSNILLKETVNKEVFTYLHSLLEESGSIHYTETKFKELKTEAMREIQKFKENKLMLDFINDFYAS